jgi:esterase
MHQRASLAHCDDQTESQCSRFTLSSGLTLNVVQWRPPQTNPFMPTLLLLHGLGDSTCVWRDVAAGLQAHANVLAVDLRGHGDSSWPSDADYLVPSMAADIAELVRVLGSSKVTLVGHSMGAAVALRMAADYPQQVERLVLADLGLDSDPESVVQLRGALREAHRPYASVDEYAAVLRARHPVAQPDLLQWVAQQTTRCSPSGLIELKYDLRVLAARERATSPASPTGKCHDTWRQLAALSCPVMVLRGAASSVLSIRVANEMIATVKDGTFGSIPRAGHSIQLDNPGAVTNAIKQFLRLPNS